MDDKIPQVLFESEVFESDTMKNEIAADERCRTLVRQFHDDLLARGYTALNASDFAYSADFYLRDYLLDFCRLDFNFPEPGMIRKFAANWFIRTTLDPDISVLKRHLEGIRELYDFMRREKLISDEQFHLILPELSDIEYYSRRIDSFNSIAGDGYAAWEAECPITF